MEIPIINVNVPHEMVTLAQFSELPLYLLFLKNNQAEIILKPKKQIWVWQIDASLQ